MLAFEWANLTHLGAFVAGVIVSAIVVLRLAKILAAFFKQDPGDPDR